MKNKILKGLILPVVSLLCITGCGKEENHFEVAKKNMQELKSYSVDINMTIGMKTGGVSVELPINMNSDFDVENKMTKMEMSTEVLGSKTKITTYIDATDEENTIEYTLTDGSSWEKSTKTGDTTNNSDALVDFDNFKEVESDDKDYYLYEVNIPKEKMTELLKNDAMGNFEQDDIVNSIEYSSDIKFKYYINKKTNYGEKIVADLTDFAVIKVPESNQKVELTKLYFEVKFSNFNDVGEIKVPDEALNINSDTTNKMICSANSEAQGMAMELSYIVDYEGDYVTHVTSTEKITFEDATTLEAFKSVIENGYKPFDEIDYYDYNIEVTGNVLTSTVNIDYSKIDIDKMLEVNPDSSMFIKNGKVKVATLQSVYETIGATCSR